MNFSTSLINTYPLKLKFFDSDKLLGGRYILKIYLFDYLIFAFITLDIEIVK